MQDLESLHRRGDWLDQPELFRPYADACRRVQGELVARVEVPSVLSGSPGGMIAGSLAQAIIERGRIRWRGSILGIDSLLSRSRHGSLMRGLRRERLVFNVDARYEFPQCLAG